MLSEEEIRKLRPYLQIKIDSMRDLTKGYKEAVDKCDPGKISSHAISLGILREHLENNKRYLTKKQEDHSPSPDGIIYQTKGKLYDHINRFWILNCQNERDKNFDFLIFYCASKEGKYIERIYIIPKEEIIKRKTITIYKKPSKGKSWYEEYRVKDLDELKKVNDIWKKIL